MNTKILFNSLISFHLFAILIACNKKCKLGNESRDTQPSNIGNISRWDTVSNSNIKSKLLLRTDFVDSKTGYIVGAKGTILKTSNGGSVFDTLNSISTEDFYAIDFINSYTGYIGGNKNTLLKTTDGGLSWQSLIIYPTNIRGIFFFNSTEGYICGSGGSLQKTLDGGQSWFNLNTGTFNDLYGIFFISKKEGYISGRGGFIAKTIDGGNNWNQISTGISFNSSAILYNMQFINSKIGFISGGVSNASTTYILKTTDGGSSWTNLTAPNIGYKYYIQFLDASIGYGAGSPDTSIFHGSIIKTVNGGKDWQEVHVTKIGLYGIKLVNSNLCIAVGDSSQIIKGTD